ncbi:MAG: DUF2283 domain-containing protein [Solirubrobacteraceae bacterium]
MSRVRVGAYEFDHVDYDEVGDVLYLSSGPPRAAVKTYGTPEGHAVRLDEGDEVVGITFVNAKWLLEQEGRLAITVPRVVETQVDDLTDVLAGSAG